MATATTLEEFLEERNKFLSTDQSIEAIKAFHAKWNPGSKTLIADIVAEAGYYKARLGWLHCPEPQRKEARKWLTTHGFTLDEP